MSYTPTYPGEGLTPQWIYDELQRIAAEMNKANTLQFDVLAAAPTRPQEGTVALADGVNWLGGSTLTASANAGLNIFIGGAWRHLFTGGLGVVDGTQFGLIADGVTDNLTAFYNIFNSRTRIVYVPGGDYYVSGKISLTGSAAIGLMIVGAGEYCTRIFTNSKNQNLIYSDRLGLVISNLWLDNIATATAGYALSLNAGGCTARNLYITGFYNSIYTAGAVNRILETHIRDGRSGGLAIMVTGGDLSPVIGNCLIDSPLGANGIYLRDCAALELHHTSVLEAGACFVMAPVSGENVFSAKVDHCFFDTASQGIVIAPSGTAGVYRCEFDHCWTGSMSVRNVLLYAPNTYNVIDGISFYDHECYLCSGDGVVISGPGVKNILFDHSKFAGNGGAGASVDASCTAICFHDCHFGAIAGLGQNSYGDVWINSGVGRVEIHGGSMLSTNKLISGINVDVRGVHGYKTAASGRVTISADNYFVWVNPGLDATWSMGELVVTPVTPLYNASKWWATTLTAGVSFQLFTDVTTSTAVQFSWSINTEHRNI